MVEGLYRGWDELRTVPSGSQSGVRAIVLFTDGASNGVPGSWDASGTSKAARTWDFPKNAVDPDNQTWNSPHIDGLYDAQTGAQSPSYSGTFSWNASPCHSYTLNSLNSTWPKYMPLQTYHAHRRSTGIPAHFPFETGALTVDGTPQSTARPLVDFDAGVGRYPACVWNINNAARNVLEIIADAARSDTGDYPIRIYTIGMGYLLQDMLGTMPEKPEDILKRISNDPRSPDHNSSQADGKYYFAPTAADVAPAFEALQSELIRLSR
jgi:hypothetical protein